MKNSKVCQVCVCVCVCMYLLVWHVVYRVCVCVCMLAVWRLFCHGVFDKVGLYSLFNMSLLSVVFAANVQDNMSVVIVLFPNHTKPVPGFVVPSLAPDEDEQQRMQDNAVADAELNRRLSQLVAAQQGIVFDQSGEPHEGGAAPGEDDQY